MSEPRETPSTTPLLDALFAAALEDEVRAELDAEHAREQREVDFWRDFDGNG